MHFNIIYAAPGIVWRVLVHVLCFDLDNPDNNRWEIEVYDGIEERAPHVSDAAYDAHEDEIERCIEHHLSKYFNPEAGATDTIPTRDEALELAYMDRAA